MASDNSKTKIIRDPVSEVIEILGGTTAENMPQQLDRIARLLLGVRYVPWVQAYEARTGKPWIGRR